MAALHKFDVEFPSHYPIVRFSYKSLSGAADCGTKCAIQRKVNRTENVLILPSTSCRPDAIDEKGEPGDVFPYLLIYILLKVLRNVSVIVSHMDRV